MPTKEKTTKTEEEVASSASTNDAPQPGDAGMPPAVKDAADSGDPTKEGSPLDLRPFDTRSMADASAGLSDADVMTMGGAGGKRNRQEAAKDGGASIDVPDGGGGFVEPDVDEMTADQCKAFLLSYGVDAPVGDAKRALRALIERTRAGKTTK